MHNLFSLPDTSFSTHFRAASFSCRYASLIKRLIRLRRTARGTFRLLTTNITCGRDRSTVDAGRSRGAYTILRKPLLRVFPEAKSSDTADCPLRISDFRSVFPGVVLTTACNPSYKPGAAVHTITPAQDRECTITFYVIPLHC